MRDEPTDPCTKAFAEWLKTPPGVRGDTPLHTAARNAWDAGWKAEKAYRSRRFRARAAYVSEHASRALALARRVFSNGFDTREESAAAEVEILTSLEAASAEGATGKTILAEHRARMANMRQALAEADKHRREAAATAETYRRERDDARRQRDLTEVEAQRQAKLASDSMVAAVRERDLARKAYDERDAARIELGAAKEALRLANEVAEEARAPLEAGKRGGVHVQRSAPRCYVQRNGEGCGLHYDCELGGIIRTGVLRNVRTVRADRF